MPWFCVLARIITIIVNIWHNSHQCSLRHVSEELLNWIASRSLSVIKSSRSSCDQSHNALNRGFTAYWFITCPSLFAVGTSDSCLYCKYLHLVAGSGTLSTHTSLVCPLGWVSEHKVCYLAITPRLVFVATCWRTGFKDGSKLGLSFRSMIYLHIFYSQVGLLRLGLASEV